MKLFKTHKDTPPDSKDSKETIRKTPQRRWWKQSWNRIIKTLIFFIITFTLSLVLIYRIDQSFRIDTLTVRGETSQAPFKGKDQYKGIHIWDISEEQLKQYLHNANPYYRVQSVEISYPSTVLVTVSQLVPSAYLTVDSGFVLLSRDGIVLEKSRDDPGDRYPRIAFYQNVPYNAFQRGDEIGYKEVVDSLYFLDIVQGARLKVKNIDITSFYMLGLYTENGTFLFSSEKDRELQMYQFEQSLKQVSLEGISFDTLDFRFDKPIVRL